MAELACPRCGAVHKLTTVVRDHWDPRISRFRCNSCSLVLVLGVAAWAVPHGPPVPPRDSVPNLKESQALRGIYMREEVVLKGGEVNLLVDEEE